MLMKKKHLGRLSTFALLLAMATPALQAHDNIKKHAAKSDAALTAALGADIRTDEDKARDGSRKPMETLRFFGIKEDMRVLELLPGRGWYTKILGSYLNDSGELFLSMRANREYLTLEQWGLNTTTIVGEGYEFSKTEQRGIFDLGPGKLGVSNLDAVLTFRNLHNISEDSRKKLNADIYKALKPGGIYGVIDHTRRHNAPLSDELWRRLDPVVVIKETLDAGFELVSFSDIHYRPADELVFDSTHESINRDSDRFTLKFRKPLN